MGGWVHQCVGEEGVSVVMNNGGGRSCVGWMGGAVTDLWVGCLGAI